MLYARNKKLLRDDLLMGVNFDLFDNLSSFQKEPEVSKNREKPHGSFEFARMFLRALNIYDGDESAVHSVLNYW